MRHDLDLRLRHPHDSCVRVQWRRRRVDCVLLQRIPRHSAHLASLGYCRPLDQAVSRRHPQRRFHFFRLERRCQWVALRVRALRQIDQLQRGWQRDGGVGAMAVDRAGCDGGHGDECDWRRENPSAAPRKDEVGDENCVARAATVGVGHCGETTQGQERCVVGSWSRDEEKFLWNRYFLVFRRLIFLVM